MGPSEFYGLFPWSESGKDMKLAIHQKCNQPVSRTWSWKGTEHAANLSTEHEANQSPEHAANNFTECEANQSSEHETN